MLLKILKTFYITSVIKIKKADRKRIMKCLLSGFNQYFSNASGPPLLFPIGPCPASILRMVKACFIRSYGWFAIVRFSVVYFLVDLFIIYFKINAKFQLNQCF